jgi:hypothetical protein
VQKFYVGDKEIKPGDVVTNHRQESWKFLSISRERAGNSLGKVYMQDETRPNWKQEFYPSVFDGELRNAG